MKTFDLLLYFTIISFLFFGATCLFAARMKLEFIRYGLTSFQRKLTGVLQVLGALGLAYGAYGNHLVGMIASAGLILLMLMGVVVRIKIKDGLYKSSPAVIYLCLSAILCFKFWQLL